MVNISSPYLSNNEIHLQFHNKTRGSSFKQNVCGIANKIFHYLHRNQTALSVAIWSYVFIEVGVAASELALGENYVYDMDSCRNVLCNYWGNYSETQPNALPNLQFRCSPSDRNYHLSYSFLECLTDLCVYTNNIGTKFYACFDHFNSSNIQPNKTVFKPNASKDSSEEILTNQFGYMLKKVCPEVILTHSSSFENLSNITYCIKKLCKYNDVFEMPFSEDIVDLCESKSLTRLGERLNKINKSVNKVATVLATPDSWTTASTVSAVIGGIWGLLSAAASTATVVLMYKTGQASSAIVPSLTEGLESITRTVTQTTRAMIQEAITEHGEMISMEARNTLNEVSDELEHSLYYSAEEIPMEDLEAGGLAGLEAGSSEGATLGLMGAMFNGIRIGVTQTLKKIAITAKPSFFNPDRGVMKATDLTGITENCLNNHTFPIEQGEGNIEKQITCLKNSLLDWHNAFCFYSKNPKFLACRYPLLEYKKETLIEIPYEDMSELFSEHISTLCHYFSKALWCDWNKLLNILCPTRTIYFFQKCPWDQFALTVEENFNDMYKIKALGACYNETGLIKV